ncbi:L-asparaginase II [Actinokineospora iranica]|uniref:L-asparaginase II n=1 Tax=Actinokineospora iranica TaxID=1271860 RepID=A0A1G6QBG4_9PSEU|nr:L-asparaginase II [Actinokineospora iranica]
MESVHRGSVVVLAPDGRVRLAVGEVDKPVFTRSCNKPLQAVGLLRAGLDLPDDADLAMACASHSGEPDHVDRVIRILAKHGLAESDLGCPPDWPMHEDSRHRVIAAGGGPRAAAMNCSGKHAAMLATCVQRGWDTGGYLAPGHPVQAAVADAIASLTGEALGAPAVDGCGAPLFAVSLTALAAAYARLVTASLGERRVADAMRAYPYLVGGTDRDDTDLMRAVPGLLVKGGAEGVHALALPDGTALAMKIDDGAARPRTPVLVGVLRALGWAVPGFAEPVVLGGGAPVGAVRLVDGILAGLI